MASNECGGYREGLVLSPPAGLIADTSSLCLSSAFPPGASLFSRHDVASNGRGGLRRGVLAKPDPRKSVESLRREIRFGPGYNGWGC